MRLLLFTFCWSITVAEAVPVRLLVTEGKSGPFLPCRIHLKAADGQPIRAPELPFWKDHFVCNGRADLNLPPGVYSYEIERGPEYFAARGDFEVEEATPLAITNRLRRIANLAREGWWSGDLHVHRPSQDIELLMRAEDLHIGPVITWWNNSNPWAGAPLPASTVRRFDEDRFYSVMAGEDERGGGALLYFGLKEPLPIAGARREFPSPMKFLREASGKEGVWVDIEKPFWWDAPLWAASGLADSIGIANNHMHRGGMLDSEAWGKPRDRERYSGPHGNGLWTQDIYYHLLNCGIRLPPSAGSASGVLPNPVGYNRVYVHLDGRLTWEKWWQGLRAGKSFVSNGPLLRCRANGELPGHVFRVQAPLKIRLDIKLDSRDPIDRIELVRNGNVERIPSSSTFTVSESGWFLVRAIADVTNTFRFASTAPFYVEFGKAPPRPRSDSAKFFLDWTAERIEALQRHNGLTPAQREEVLEPWREAQKVWQDKIAQGSRDTFVTGRVVDSRSGKLIPARVYIQGAGGRWFFPDAAVPNGSAVRYEKRNWINRDAVEYHTTLSADPFQIGLQPGTYRFTIERGKEYRPLTQTIEVRGETLTLEFPLYRWVNMAAHGWFSGDTHVHRSLEELPNVMLAEDLNVAFPLTYWVTKGFAPPSQGDKGAGAAALDKPIHVDETHVIWPRNTEWEIFTVDGKRHTLGAVFALGHKEPFSVGAPPVKAIAREAKRQGALLDLDKHDWPWSMALVPLMNVDLFELANNHIWRTEFGFTNWNANAAELFGRDAPMQGGNERDWIEFGFRNYYALLNCGFRMRPTAGTASGVHPVPLGFGRVYVHLPKGFTYQAWFEGLDEGRSFVTTGPMLLARIEGRTAGAAFELASTRPHRAKVEGTVLSEEPMNAVEIVVNGTAQEVPAKPRRNRGGAWEASFAESVEIDGTSWVAVRCWERREDGRERFAHTAPAWFEMPDRPIRPTRSEATYLIERVRGELQRSRGVLPEKAIKEYEEALAILEPMTNDTR